MKKIRKRFIAGAICPRCHAIDTLALLHEEQGEKVACVKCDYHEYEKEHAIVNRVHDPEKIIHRFYLK